MFPKALLIKGFTLVEVIVVVSIMVTLIGMAVVGFKNFASFQQYNQAVNSVEFVLNETRLSARSAESDSSHGVKFTANSITQFVGDTYSAIDPSNKVTTFTLVTLNPVLTGGVDEIVFTKLTGLPVASGIVEVSGVSFSAVTDIEITSGGIVQ